MSHKVSSNVAYCMLNVWSDAKINIAMQILRLFGFTRGAELGVLQEQRTATSPGQLAQGVQQHSLKTFVT